MVAGRGITLDVMTKAGTCKHCAKIQMESALAFSLL
jgi:hypothetical protein